MEQPSISPCHAFTLPGKNGDRKKQQNNNNKDYGYHFSVFVWGKQKSRKVGNIEKIYSKGQIISSAEIQYEN